MKRIAALLLALSMLIALAAPALAKEVIAGGQYMMDVNLEVPDGENDLIGTFTAMIPDGVDLQYGVRETDLFYWIDVDTDRMPEGMCVSMDVLSEYFREWTYKDENDVEQYDYGFIMENEETGNCITYRLIRNDGFQIQGADFGYEFGEEHMRDNYQRFICGARNAVNEDSHADGKITLCVDYDPDNLPDPGHYYSKLKFYFDVKWAFTMDEVEERGYRYIIKDGYEYRKGDDDTAAFASDGWPYLERIERVERLGG